MSRYYRIEIDGGPTYTSFDNGFSDPAALQIELDLPVAPFATPSDAGAFVKIWGIPLSDIRQSKDLRFKAIKIYGGFQKGLPLAKPQQSGLLVSGYIFQPFGNWSGLEQSLVLYILAGPPPEDTKSPNKPRNLVVNWKQNQSMADAIKQTISTAFSGYTTNINISDKLKLPTDDAAVFDTFDAFSRYCRDTSIGIIRQPGYAGVSITLRDKVFYIYDGSAAPKSTTPTTAGSQQQPSANKQIAFDDLIGQPTWIEAPLIQFMCNMRADISVGDQVQLPQTITQTTSAAQSSLFNHDVAFQGGFQIVSMRHVGNYRQPTAEAWSTTFNAAPLQQSGS